MNKVTIDRALIEQAIEALANVEVAGPDDDGVIWINLPGNGVTGKAILRVGKRGLIAAQCATLFDEQRVGAIAALRAALAEPAVEPVSDDLRDMLVAISAAIADQDDRAAQAMIREILSSPPPPAEPEMTDTVTRLMGLADEFMIQEREGTNGYEARQALHDELVRLFTPLSDGNIRWLWSEAHNDTTDRMPFQVFAKAIEQAHGIGGES